MENKEGEDTHPIDLHKLNPLNEHNEPLINAPSLMIDVESVKLAGNRIGALSALIIVKEQLKFSGIRKQTIREYDYIFWRFITSANIELLIRQCRLATSIPQTAPLIQPNPLAQTYGLNLSNYLR